MKIKCPYCGAEMDCHEDDKESGEDYEMQCEKCKKYFVFDTEYIRVHESRKAPCLNGGDHLWEVPSKFFINKQRCHYCAAEKELVSEDAEYVEYGKKLCLYPKTSEIGGVFTASYSGLCDCYSVKNNKKIASYSCREEWR